MSSVSNSEESNSHASHTLFNSITFDNDNDDYLDDDDDDNQSNESIDNSTNRKKTKKTLGRVKIKMAYIDNKIRRYTTFSKRKTGIMKKAYELATLTGTEVMLLVASETGHVYTYATSKLQPMITSEAGKALIQTCLAKDEPIIKSPSTITTLNNDDVVRIDENQRKKRTNKSDDISPKRMKSNSSNEIKQVTPPTTVAVPLSYLINSNSPQQQSVDGSTSYTIDLNSLKQNGMNFILTPPSNTSQTSPPFVLTLDHYPPQPL